MERLCCLWPWTLLLPLGLGSGSLAQEADQPDAESVSARFSLFGDRLDADVPTEQETREADRRRRAADADDPEFTLLGTSRIGDRYSAILRHRDGTEVVVVSNGGGETVITGFEQYALLDVNAGRVSLRFPAQAFCVESPDAGVTCPGDGTAVLELTVGTPLARALVANHTREFSEPAPGEIRSTPPLPTSSTTGSQNPQRQRVGAGASGSPGANVSQAPRRIDPADVPPGMMIVSKPSGDLLVPED